MVTDFKRVIIAYGSESGNAEQLARKLNKLSCLYSRKLELVDLDQLQLQGLDAKDFVLVVTSTFGDGEPPGNADEFAERLAATASLPSFQYAVFAIGDVAYTNFCKFGQDIDAQFNDKGAIRVVNRVDADINYHAFFQQWTDTVCAVFAGDSQIGQQLQLKVTSYSETSPHQATIRNISRLNTSSSGVYQIELDISNSGMNYRAGDLLYVLPNNQPELLQSLAVWFNNKQVYKLLQDKELRLLGKSLLRTLAKKSNNLTLKEKLKVRNKEALANYLYGRDLLDVLQDCGDCGFISLVDLVDELPQQAARAYSISSSDLNKENKSKPTQVSLCIRDVAYEFEQRKHFGAASHRLCHGKTGEKINVFVRSNPSFHLHLVDNANNPIIMIGAGTGIAPYIGFLQQIEAQDKQTETLLIFGERYQKQDFLYQSELERWLKLGVLSQLVTAFSRDQEQKYYVQHAIIEQGEKVWSLLNKGAVIYVCGSKKNLSIAVTDALTSIVLKYGNQSITQAEKYIVRLFAVGRYRQDLY